MSCLLWVLDPTSLKLSAATSFAQPSEKAELEKHFPTWDRFNSAGSWYSIATTNIYKTKDGRFFHLHGRSCSRDASTEIKGSHLLATETSLTVLGTLGSMNPAPTLKSIGLPSNMDFTTPEEANAHVQEAVLNFTAEELQALVVYYV